MKEMGARFPVAFDSILLMQNAALSLQGKSRVLASTQKRLKFTDVAATARRLFGSCGGTARQDILITGDADGPLGSDKEQAARATYEKARTHGAGQERRDG